MPKPSPESTISPHGYCTSCGHARRPAAVFCSHCGERLSARPAAKASEPPAAPKPRRRVNAAWYWWAVPAVLLLVAAPYASDQMLLASQRQTPVGIAASELDLTRKGELLIYRAESEIQGKAMFRQSCPSSIHNAELGCYDPNTNRIYVLDIEAEGLQMQENITLAHEMLHAAYEELSPRERERIDALVEAEAARINDPELEELMAGYEKRTPGVRANELHSFLGTEYGNLSLELEEHYARYFADRSVVVYMQQDYERALAAVESELQTLRASIDFRKAELGRVEARMDHFLATGQVHAYNALVPRQNALVDETNAAVDTYNTRAEEARSLYVALDSTDLSLPSAPARSAQ